MNEQKVWAKNSLPCSRGEKNPLTSSESGHYIWEKTENCEYPKVLEIGPVGHREILKVSGRSGRAEAVLYLLSLLCKVLIQMCLNLTVLFLSMEIFHKNQC